MNICYITTTKVLNGAFEDNDESRKEYFMQKRFSGFLKLLAKGFNVYLVDAESYTSKTKSFNRSYKLVADPDSRFGLSSMLSIDPLKPDFCWQRKYYPGSENCTSLNDPKLIKICSAQVLTYQTLSELGFSAVVVSEVLPQGSNEEKAINAFDNAAQQSRTGKVMAKRSRSFASRGVKVLSVANKLESIQHIVEQLSTSDMLVQPYLATSQPKGYTHGIVRVVVVGSNSGSKVVSTFWRLAKGREIVNAEQDILVYEDISPRYLRRAEAVAVDACAVLAKHLNLSLYELGVDVIFDGKNPLVLEINSGPIRLSVLNKNPHAAQMAAVWDDAVVELIEKLSEKYK